MPVVEGMRHKPAFLLAAMIRVAAVLTWWLPATMTTARQAPLRALSGVPRIVDGDTLVINGTHIRFEAIDAPETDQVCLDAKGARWACGVEARDWLREHVSNREISCIDKGTDRYKRTLAVCSLAGEELNRWLVRQGLALAYVQYSRVYVDSEAEARHALRGLWSGAFIAPWDWRHRDRRTVILGAVSIPANAQAILLAPASANGSPSSDCTIKGNVNRKGERIYHMPGQRDYTSINMAPRDQCGLPRSHSILVVSSQSFSRDRLSWGQTLSLGSML
jgi:endonuclease YncB( thermonuclease family)